MKINTKLAILIFSLCMFNGYNAEAQFFKKLKNKVSQATSGNKKNSKKEVAQDKVEEDKVHSPWHASNVGKIQFYSRLLKKNSAGDTSSGTVTEHVVGGTQPLYMRAYLDKDLKALCSTCDNLEIRYTIAGTSFTTQELRDKNAPVYGRMASAYHYYDKTNYALGTPLISASGEYTTNYTLQEDTFRMLLSMVKGKLTQGATVPLKVEVLGLTNDGVAVPTVMAEGTINLKVTAESNSLQGPDCRCGRSGMTDAKVIKEVKDAFMFQFTDVKKVHKVVLLARDFKENYDNSYPVKNVVAKGMDANIVYEHNDGTIMMVKRYIFFKKDGTGFSDKATIGKHVFYLPVSPTCVK